MEIGALLLFEVEHYWEREKVGDLIQWMEDEMLPEFLMIIANIELLTIYLQSGRALQLLK